MKTLLLIFTLAFSSQAFSKHNYFQETCSFNSTKGEVGFYKTNYWDGFHSVMTGDLASDLGNDPEVYLPGEEGSGDDKITGQELIIFSDVKDSNEVQEPYDDGCWQGFTKTFDRTVRIQNIKSNVKELLKINSGDELTMKCSYEHLVVLGGACNEL